MDPGLEEAVRNLELIEVQPTPPPTLPDGPVSVEEMEDFFRRKAEWLIRHAILGESEHPHLQLGPPFQPAPFDPSEWFLETDADGNIVLPDNKEKTDDSKASAPPEAPVGLTPLASLATYDQATRFQHLQNRLERIRQLELEEEMAGEMTEETEEKEQPEEKEERYAGPLLHRDAK